MVKEPALEGFEEEDDIVWGAALRWLSSSGKHSMYQKVLKKPVQAFRREVAWNF